jgi:hypothetical protein
MYIVEYIICMDETCMLLYVFACCMRALNGSKFVTMDMPSPNFLPSKQHTQNFLGCRLFAKKLQVNCSAQLFGFVQKILGTKHAQSEQRMQSPTDSERHFPRAIYLCW